MTPAFVAVFLAICFYIPYANHKKVHAISLSTSIEKENLLRYMYNSGFNDALDSIALLDLELKLNGERKNWGEMQDILRKRFNVPKIEKINEQRTNI